MHGKPHFDQLVATGDRKYRIEFFDLWAQARLTDLK